MNKLTKEETETSILCNANRDYWDIFTCDPYWITRFKRFGWELVPMGHNGFRVKVPFDQLRLYKRRKGGKGNPNLVRDTKRITLDSISTVSAPVPEAISEISSGAKP